MERIPADGTGKLVGKNLFFSRVHIDCQCPAFGDTQGRFETFRQPLLDVGIDSDTVDDDINRVFLIFFQSRQFIHVDNCRWSNAAFDAETDESLCLHLFEEIDVFAFPVDDNGRQNHQTGSFRHG